MYPQKIAWVIINIQSCTDMGYSIKISLYNIILT
jgi:hypothetical protein